MEGMGIGEEWGGEEKDIVKRKGEEWGKCSREGGRERTGRRDGAERERRGLEEEEEER